MSTIKDIIESESRAIIEEFNLATKQGEGSPQEIADFRENAVQSFIGRFYPRSHVISKGKITDIDGNQSDSIDCLVLNPAHPNLIDSKGKFRLIISDGCDSAIEVKPNLARTDELIRGLEQCISVKKVRRSKSAMLMTSTKPKHLVEHSKYIPFYLFCIKSFDVVDLIGKVRQYYADNKTPVESQIDGICIHGLGIIKHIKHHELNIYNAPPPIGKNTGWYIESWGPSTLIGFLLGLEYSFGGVPEISESIMKRVLTKIGQTTISRIADCV